jgi:hypothetical protein
MLPKRFNISLEIKQEKAFIAGHIWLKIDFFKEKLYYVYFPVESEVQSNAQSTLNYYCMERLLLK